MALTNSQYDTIIREYNRKQLHNRHLQDARIKEVYETLPQVKELDASISNLSVEQARKMLSGDPNALDNLKESIAALSKKRQALMAGAGFPADYMEPSYDCPDCHDTGFIGNSKCHCFKQAVIDMLYTQSNLKEILQSENFSHFTYEFYDDRVKDPSTGRTALETAKSAVMECLDFVKNFDTKHRNLFFYGDTGVGKTFLSNCIAKELIDTAHSVIYLTAFQLFDIFAKNTFSGNNSPEENMYQYIFDCDLLIIDDLGTELTNSFTSSQLFLCVQERIARKKSVIISTNLPLEIFVRTYSERTFSRITSNYTMLKLVGEDIRIKKKLGGNL